MPAVQAAVLAVRRADGDPVRRRAVRLPRRVADALRVAPAAVREVLEVDLAVVGVERPAQGTDRVEALDRLVARRPGERRVAEADVRRVCALAELPLLADLRLGGAGVGAVGRGRHPQDAVPDGDVPPPPGRTRDAGPARPRPDDPPVAGELGRARVGEVVEEHRRGRRGERSRGTREERQRQPAEGEEPHARTLAGEGDLAEPARPVGVEALRAGERPGEELARDHGEER